MSVELYTSPAAMEPLFPERGEVALSDLAAEVFKRSGALFGRLPKQTRDTVAEILRYTIRESHWDPPFDMNAIESFPCLAPLLAHKRAHFSSVVHP